MALSKGAKVAIGCGIALVVAAVAAVVIFGGMVWWARGKVRDATAGLEQAADQQKKVEELQRKANRNAFTPPADGVVQEDRLLKFLGVRKQVFAVYESHKAEFEAMRQEKPQGMEGLKALGKVATLVNEARLAQAQGLADQGMSEAEYRYLIENVYKSAWASELAKSTGGKSYSEATGDTLERAAEEAEKTAQQAEQAGQPPEMVKALRENARQMRERASSAREEARKMDVPPANIELFRKHEAEIKTYAMSGLEWIGL